MEDIWKMKNIVCLLFISCLLGPTVGHVIDIITAKHRYEQIVRPNFYENKPVNIFVRFKVFSADDIDVQRGDFQMDINFYFTWVDQRLSFDGEEEYDHDSLITISDVALVNKIWIPDILIVNAKDIFGHSLQYVTISRTGKVTLSIRKNVRAACNVDLNLFPWDTQHCPIIIQSYSQSSNDLIMHWEHQAKTGGNDNSSFVSGIRERPMAQFDLQDLKLFQRSMDSFGRTFNHDSHSHNDKSSTLEAVFTFNRLNGFYLIQTLAPSNILVILSWIAFLIRPEDCPPRVYLGISSILTMASIQNFINYSLPKVSYIKIIDIYCLTCYFFVVLVMVEYAVVLLLNERVKKEDIFLKENKLPRKINNRIKQVSSFCKFWPKLKLCVYGNPFCMHITKKVVRTVDKVSMFVFPISYLIFNIVYWNYVANMIRKKPSLQSVASSYV